MRSENDPADYREIKNHDYKRIKMEAEKFRTGLLNLTMSMIIVAGIVLILINNFNGSPAVSKKSVLSSKQLTK
ncbi:MAG: hypothetical protein JW801_00560 [Bacteroidales bacterium]|nr:hypothetical protein [Bacteroidales bacterium]